MNSKIKYTFPFGETIGYQVIHTDELHRIEERAGLYGWYLRLPKNELSVHSVLSFGRIVLKRRLDVAAKGPLREQYSGHMDRDWDETIVDSDTLSGIDLGTAVFAPPVYIGMSNNLRSRLEQHVTHLRVILQSGRQKTENKFLEIKEYDTEKESAFFAERIGFELLRENVKHTKWLFIKVVYLEECERSDILNLERYLNLVLTPTLGRR